MDISNIDSEIIKDNTKIDFLSRVITSGPSFYHTHSYYEIFYMISGTVEHYFNGKKEILGPGDLYILTPGDVHNFLGSEETYSHRDIMISCQLWNTMCANLHVNLFDFLLPTQQKIHLSLDAMHSFEASFNSFFQFNIKSKEVADNPFCYIIISDIFKRFLMHYCNAESAEHAATPLWLVRLINQLSLPENITKDKREILSTLHYSPEYICRSFKQHMHMTLTDFINSKRLDLAASMFYSTSKTVNDICHDCGFESTAYFTKLFKARFGVVPSKFRSSQAE